MFGWFTGSSTRPPIFLKLRSSKTFIVLTVSSSIFTDIFVYGIVVPVLPFALKTRANINPAQIQTWISILLAVYGAALLVAAPIFGWLADRFNSRRIPLILGLLALGGSTAMLCVGSSIGVLCAGRAIQGLSAAVVWTVGLALIVDTVESEEIGQVMGYVGLSMTMSMLVAPLLGGVVFETAGYYAVFAMAFGLMVLDIFMRVVMIEKKFAVKWLPPTGAAVDEGAKKTMEENRQSVTDIEMEAVETNESQVKAPSEQHNKTRPGLEQVTSTTSAPLAAAEKLPGPLKRLASRLPPVIFLLGSRRLMSALFGCVIQATLLAAFDSILPLYVRRTFHWNSIGAGLIFLPVAIVSFGGPIVGWLSDKHGPRLFAIAGYLFASPFLVMLRLVTKNTLDQKILLCALLGLVGLCLTLVLTPMMAEIAYAVDAKEQRHAPGFFGKNGAYAQAYSLFNIAWAAGFMIGPLLAGLVNQANGWATATLILGCVSLFTAIPTAIWTGGSIFKKRRKQKEERQRTQGDTTDATADG